ncbi:hypothetical protein LCGC14_1223530 [marine sediment metagenome]|uniref:Uncharacterized protein n=1 Tax=marine sediment metagenome TaxID=412755 RepID=A0A0F9NSX0_9ZZZZ
MRVNVIYEDNFRLDLVKAFEITEQWLRGQHKAKIKTLTPPKFIEAKQGTMMTNTGHDPNWKKRIRISFFELASNNIMIRIEAAPIARNVFRVEKLKQSWYDGLFSYLFSLLKTVEKQPKTEIREKFESKEGYEIKYCPNCGKKIVDITIICSSCGIDIH